MHFSDFVQLSVIAAAPAMAKVMHVEMPEQFFSGPQSGIGSWFGAYDPPMNGHSWCGGPYNDQDPVFAVDLRKMGGHTYNSNREEWEKNIKKYCGCEAKVTDPTTGKSKLLYLYDAFDPKWVRSESSIDIMKVAFDELHGSPNGDHNVVIHGVKWELTGRVNTQYAGKGASWQEKPSPSDTKPNDGTYHLPPAEHTSHTSHSTKHHQPTATPSQSPADDDEPKYARPVPSSSHGSKKHHQPTPSAAEPQYPAGEDEPKYAAPAPTSSHGTKRHHKPTYSTTKHHRAAETPSGPVLAAEDKEPVYGAATTLPTSSATTFVTSVASRPSVTPFWPGGNSSTVAPTATVPTWTKKHKSPCLI